MNLPDHILCWQALFRESTSLDQLTFETLMYWFVDLTRHLTKSSPKGLFERAIETFRVQYFNEFMYNRTDFTADSRKFVSAFSEFSENKRKSKSDYVTFLTTAMEVCGLLVGGSKGGVPLLSNFSKKCLTAPPYYKFWYYDQVKDVRQRMGIVENRCAFCPSKSTTTTQIRPGSCPASFLPICNKCTAEDYPDKVSSYLKETSDFSMPPPTPGIAQYMDEINTVLSDMVINPNETLVAYKYRLDEHGQRLSTENKQLKRSNNVMDTKMQDLVVVQEHIVADNEEYRISVQNLTRDCSELNKRAQQYHDQWHHASARCVALELEMQTLHNKYQESIAQQWNYYNMLNRT